MSLKSWLKNAKNRYVVRQVENIRFPFFDPSPIQNKRIVFYGRVQKVGFRVEIFELAKRLGLQGWVRNRKDGAVVAHIKGEENKIRFLVEFMTRLKRAKVANVVSYSLSFDETSEDFLIKEDLA